MVTEINLRLVQAKQKQIIVYILDSQWLTKLTLNGSIAYLNSFWPAVDSLYCFYTG